MMLAITLLFGLLLTWVALSVILIVLVIYRATVSVHEEDQLFLDAGDALLEREQREVVGRLQRLSPYIWATFILWLLVGLGTFGLWVWQQLH